MPQFGMLGRVLGGLSNDCGTRKGFLEVCQKVVSIAFQKLVYQGLWLRGGSYPAHLSSAAICLGGTED